MRSLLGKSLTALAVCGTSLVACAGLLDIPDRAVGDGGGGGDGSVSDAPATVTDCKAGIEIRILVDATGATKGVAVPYFFGELDYFRELNKNGGIQGCPINMQYQDYAYDPATAQTIYDQWKGSPDWDKVAAVFGFGSGDTLQLAPHAREDQKPLISASYFGGLAAPNPVAIDVNVPELDATFVENSFPTHLTSDGFPYNFFTGTDYSTGIRIGMFHVKTQGGKRVGFFHCSAAYCTGPIPAGRTYARAQGLNLGRDLTVELTDDQTKYNQQVHDYFKAEFDHSQTDGTYTPVDWVWMGNTTATTAYLVKAIANLSNTTITGPGDSAAEKAYLTSASTSVQVIVNNWGFDETLSGLCGPACNGRVHGIVPFTAYDDASRGSTEIKKVSALHDAWRAFDTSNPGSVRFGDGGAPPSGPFKNVRYVQGYVSAYVFRIAIERVIAAGKPITGPNVKEALETFQQVDTGGLCDKLSFGSGDHRPQSTETIYKFGSDGSLVAEPPSRTIALDSNWLGW